MIRRGLRASTITRSISLLHNFCAVDLSAFYFDIRKDALYCDRPDALRRRACRTLLDLVFDHLTAWLAPILCFTAEEAWWARYGAEGETREASVHLRVFPEVPAQWRDAALAAKWAKVREVRRVVTGALELARAEKRFGSSLQAHPRVYVEPEALLSAVAAVDLAEVAITSDAELAEGAAPEDAFRLDEVPGVAVVACLAEGEQMPAAAGGSCRRSKAPRIRPSAGAVADAVAGLDSHGGLSAMGQGAARRRACWGLSPAAGASRHPAARSG